ncbi:MAG: hypothetical protein AAGA37_19775 [Actinomycetota bacterium]
MARKLTLSFDDLTNRDLELIERHSGLTMAKFTSLIQAGDTAELPYALVTVLTFVALKAVKPDATIDEVLDAKPGEFALDMSGGDDPLDETPDSSS